MATSTQEPPVQADETTDLAGLSPQDVKKQQRLDRIDARAQKLLITYRTEDQKLSPDQRRTEQQLWKTARRQAEKEERSQRVKQATKDTARRGRDTAYAEVKSALHRNRAQLAPWCLAAPYATLGAGAWALAEYGSGHPVAISALVAATEIGAGILAWRKLFAKRAPHAFAQRIKATLALLTVWSVLMPLLPNAAQGGMWLALLAGVGYMALPWWREHEHPLPIQPAPAEPTPEPIPTEEPQVAAEPESQATRRINGILDAWHTKVAKQEKGAVPGSTLTYERSTDAVDRYVITLDDEGPVTQKDLPNKQEKIALAVGVLEQNLSFENTDHPATIILRHLVGNPVVDYDGPVVLCNGTPIHSRWEITPGSTVDIVYGYYTDGDGMASYRVIDAGSVNSQFVLGGTGSGKTRLMEIIAIGLRFLGASILYVDGQDGASSNLLNEHADQVISCDKSGLEGLISTLGSASTARNAELRTRPELKNEYTYDPKRPPIILMLEEAHAAFCLKRNKQKTFGQALGEFAVQIRKLGIGFVAASQDFDLVETFGNSAKLRSSMLATGNFAAMRLVDKSRIGMLPSGCPKLDAIPPKGYGFSPFSERKGALWRTPNLDGGKRDKESWMTEFERAPALTAGDVPAVDTDDTDTEEEAQDHAPAPGVLHFPGAAPAAQGSATAAPTAAEQQILDLLASQQMRTADIADTQGVSVQTVRKHLRNLVKKGRVELSADDGTYVAI